ncbi:hypothetical protein M413DRAFT_27969 [Hebeloma cylindrosporum]|uniref:Mon2 C-terminal domain-containing protein n=1 Tax=Hebeloma cylindrosporum TaxID=76867 RepID=A0A0C3CB38_HEBCY|nr:hypothetical protein M413DRAFT_27969 [Hebeloma cylindrosporum h7]
MACLKVLLGCALFLAGSLGESWYAILEALQNADGVLNMMAKTGTHASGGSRKSLLGGVQPSRSVSGSQPGSSSGVPIVKHPLLSDLDVETMQLSVQKLFDSSKNLEDSAFRDFINALCKLSSEMVGMQTSLETLHQILQGAGHTLVVGWETIFQMLGSVCRSSIPASSSSSSAFTSARNNSIDSISGPPALAVRTKPIPLGLGNPTEKSYNGLVKIAFQSLTLVCDSVSSLSPEHLRLCISTLGQFGHQADTNIALTAAVSLLWSVSDAIQSKRKNVDEEPEYSELWMFLLLEVLGLCTDPRAEVRDGAIQTLFRTMQLYGATLSSETWEQCLWKVIFPLLDALTREIRNLTDPTQEYEQGVEHAAEGVLKVRVMESLDRVWEAMDMLSSSATKRYSSPVDLENSPHQPFTQEGLVAYVDVIQSTRKTSRTMDGKEWDLKRLTRLMSILKAVLTYPHSPDYRPDIDTLPPVQAIVMDTITNIDLDVPGSPSLVMRDLADYSTLMNGVRPWATSLPFAQTPTILNYFAGRFIRYQLMVGYSDPSLF